MPKRENESWEEYHDRRPVSNEPTAAKRWGLLIINDGSGTVFSAGADFSNVVRGYKSEAAALAAAEIIHANKRYVHLHAVPFPLP